MTPDDCPTPGERWRHRKGTVYLVVGSALRESDCAPLVLYREWHEDVGLTRTGGVGPVVWARPLAEWRERFERIE